jgi:hypothetical protein
MNCSAHRRRRIYFEESLAVLAWSIALALVTGVLKCIVSEISVRVFHHQILMQIITSSLESY